MMYGMSGNRGEVLVHGRTGGMCASFDNPWMLTSVADDTEGLLQ